MHKPLTPAAALHLTPKKSARSKTLAIAKEVGLGILVSLALLPMLCGAIMMNIKNHPYWTYFLIAFVSSAIWSTITGRITAITRGDHQ